MLEVNAKGQITSKPFPTGPGITWLASLRQTGSSDPLNGYLH